MTGIPTSSPAFDTALLGLKAQKQNAGMQALDDAAKDFEAMFVSEMVSCMFEGTETDPAFGGGHGEDMFKGMLVQEYGKLIANGPGIGISDQIRRAMIEMQGMQTQENET